jgi:hypothetical protein
MDAIDRRVISRPEHLKCVDCGNDAFHYDHRDYGIPLAVDPVCRKCNALRGSASGITQYVAQWVSYQMMATYPT